MERRADAPGLFGKLAALGQRPFLLTLDRWLHSKWYILTLSALTAVSALLGLDLGIYTLFILLGVFISLLSSDLLPLMPVIMLCYVAASRENNPGRYPDSVFYPMNGGIYLVTLLAVFFVCLVLRLCCDRELGGKRFLKTKRTLMPSMLLLGGAYLLSGIGMDTYGTVMLKNLVFAGIQFFAVFAMYYLFTGGVRWDRVPRDYPAWIGLSLGFVVLSQLLENYLSGRIFEEGTINRELIATGWGMHNNVGGMMAMMLPFAFYLAKNRHGWLFNLSGTVLLLGVILSCSRGSMLMAGAAYLLCAVLLLKDPESRRQNLKVYLIALGGVLAVAIILLPKLLSVFRLFISQLGNISQRDNLLYYGICQFLSEPIFGGSFFPQGSYVPWDWANLDSFSSFFPPRWHNTLVQILASCGTVGITAYAIHRYQTLKLFLQRRSRENLFIAISLGVLLCASLLDCHFFNVGPVLFYSMALAVAEKLPQHEI